MSEVIELHAEKRDVYGTTASRRLRRQADQVPAVIYGGDAAPEAITLVHRKVKKALENEAFYSSILELNLAGQKEQVVVKDIQLHPSKPDVLHVDLQRVTGKEQLTMNIPIHFANEADAPGVRAGGIVNRALTEIEVKCLPADLPESIEIDLSQLELEQTIHLSEVTLPKGVELAHEIVDADHDRSVVAIHMPKAVPIEEELEASAEEESAAENETDSAAEETPPKED